jgi:hypothetical protein
MAIRALLLRSLAHGALILALAACAQTTQLTPTSSSNRATLAAEDSASAFARFSDIPIPVDAEMDVDRSLLFGTDESWFGRLAIQASTNIDALYDFYRKEMPRFGWTEITTVRAATSVLTYVRSERVATVQIYPARFTGAKVDVTVSPRGAQSSN